MDVTVLERARERIENPSRWTQGKAARTAAGAPCAPRSADAACWCLFGAVIAESEPGDVARDAVWALQACVQANPADKNSLIVFNDSHTHEAVLELLDRALAWAQRVAT